MSQDVAILDIGSGSITALVGRRGVNNTIILSGRGRCEYAGYASGEWLLPDKLPEAIGQAISAAEASANTKITEIFVGVPGDFSTVVCKHLNLSFPRKKKVSRNDIDLLHEQGNDFESDPNYALIHSQPIYYTLDDDRRLIDPEGLPSLRLGGCISYILAEKKFLDCINLILSSIGIVKTEFVSSLLCESLYLFEDAQRDQFTIFIDVGFIASSVVIARGDGILAQYSFPLGGGNLSGALAVGLDISYAKADCLKRKVLLSLEPAKDDHYQISPKAAKDAVYSYKASKVNELVTEAIAMIASTVRKCLKLCKYDYPDNIPYYLTGGGLANIAGAKDVLAEMLENPVEVVAPWQPQFAKPELASCLGVLNLAISSRENERPSSFIKKIFSFFG